MRSHDPSSKSIADRGSVSMNIFANSARVSPLASRLPMVILWKAGRRQRSWVDLKRECEFEKLSCCLPGRSNFQHRNVRTYLLRFLLWTFDFEYIIFLVLCQEERRQGKQEIGKQFEYNQFTRDYFAANPGGSRKEMMDAWKTVRALATSRRIDPDSFQQNSRHSRQWFIFTRACWRSKWNRRQKRGK